MSEENRIGTYQFVAEPFHVDFNGRLTMGVLGNHLLNCAGFHANDRGFGIATLNEDNYTWVLSRLAIFLFLVFDDLRHPLLIGFIFSHLFKYHFRAANNFVAILLHFYVKLV